MAKQKKRVSVGLITALVKPEWQGVSQELATQGWAKVTEIEPPLQRASIEVYDGQLSGQDVRVFLGTINDMGQAAASLETMAFLDKCKPQVAILCGIAGSLDPKKVKKGDVVVANSVHWRSQNKVEDCPRCENCSECEECHAMYKYRFVSHDVPELSADEKKILAKNVEDIKNKVSIQPANIHLGDVFTWDYVLSSQRRAEQILKSGIPKALCVEMEAGGFLNAVARYKQIRYAGSEQSELITGLVVRGISDYATLKDKEPKDRKQASVNAARIAISLAGECLQQGGLAVR